MLKNSKNKWLIKLVILTVLLKTNGFAQNSKQCLIDKKQWRSDSEYRYTVAKTDSLWTFFKDKPSKEVKKILGKPNVLEDSKDNEFVYCLDIDSPKYYNKRLKKKVCCKCLGSFMVFHFKDGRVIDITVGWVS